ncbi:MAG: hypothetical protein RLY78_2661 [Pseudomonadota bacterium]
MQDFPRALKHVTAWLVLATAVFLGVQAWQAERARPAPRQMDGELVLRRAADGHYHWPATVAGQSVDFLIDTGATGSALPAELAERLGLPRGDTIQTHTAAGPARGWISHAELRLSHGPVLPEHRFMVLPGLGTPLLGMDVLSRLRLVQQGQELRISQPARAP